MDYYVSIRRGKLDVTNYVGFTQNQSNDLSIKGCYFQLKTVAHQNDLF